MTNCHDLKITSHLIKAVLDSFVPIHAPSSTTVYIARDNNSVLHQDQNVLSDLGLEVKHLIGNTDLVLKVDDPKEPRLCFVLCEHSCGHIDTKHKQALDKIASSIKLKCAYLSVFTSMQSYSKVCDSISWNTDVWLSDHPTKLIRFD